MESLRCLTIFSSTASTWASSSSMRSSTSFCLMAALIRRITARRSFWPAFIAVFMSSLSRAFRLMLDLRVSGTQKAGSGTHAGFLSSRRAGRGRPPLPRGNARSVQALALGDVARHAPQLTLHRGGGLARALLGRLLVVLALAGLGQDAGLLASALEATQRKLERLVFADFHRRHGMLRDTWISPGWAGEPRMIRAPGSGRQAKPRIFLATGPVGPQNPGSGPE